MPVSGRGRASGPGSNLRPVTASSRCRPANDPRDACCASTTSRSRSCRPTACRDRSAAAGDVPKVEIVDPVKPHRDLLPRYTDKEIQDITAYLVSLK